MTSVEEQPDTQIRQEVKGKYFSAFPFAYVRKSPRVIETNVSLNFCLFDGLSLLQLKLYHDRDNALARSAWTSVFTVTNGVPDKQ